MIKLIVHPSVVKMIYRLAQFLKEYFNYVSWIIGSISQFHESLIMEFEFLVWCSITSMNGFLKKAIRHQRLDGSL